MLELTAIVAVILFVSQAQVDLAYQPASQQKTIKLVLLALAVIAILFQRYQ